MVVGLDAKEGKNAEIETRGGSGLEPREGDHRGGELTIDGRSRRRESGQPEEGKVRPGHR